MTGRPTIPRRARTRGAVAAGAAAALVVVLLASGCGSSGGSGEASACKDRSRGLPKVTWEIPATDPSGVVILLHGGGWQPNPSGYRAQVTYGKAIAAGGVATVAVGYGRGASGFRQLEDVYSQAQRCFPGAPICAIGDSAGGNLALMLATREPDLACVIARAVPTDLNALASQGASETQRLAVDALGAGALERFSPVRRAATIKARVLLIMAENDPLVPVQQGRELKRALSSAELLVLPPGPVPFVHGLGVTPSALQSANQREVTFLQQATSGS
jgi:acetyl esterase/lipase